LIRAIAGMAMTDTQPKNTSPSMKVILNNFEGSTTFQQALGELIQGAETLSVAVSYLQVGGWEMFQKVTRGLSMPKMRIVCTDQLGITQPAAVELAIRSKVQIRNFAGNVVYHPKVFLAHDRSGLPIRFLLGSANLSTSAFSSSVEAGLLSEEAGGLSVLHLWFNDLFSRKSVAFTPKALRELEMKWRMAAAERARNRLKIRRKLEVAAGTKPVPVTAEDLDTLEDVLATIQLPIGLLNMDYAGNNVRNIAKVRQVMANPGAASDKQQSELKLLGFMSDGKLTALGRAAAAGTNATVARLWCGWLKRTPDAELEDINPKKLLAAKRVFPQFWRLKQEVRDYFLANAQKPPDRPTLQTIELLCNASQVVQDLSLEDIRTLSSLLRSERVPEYIQEKVSEYFDNKGQRGWRTDDRRIVPLAWQESEPR
jgi:HKD family nuclease